MSLVLKVGTLIDGTGAEPLRRAVVVIRDGHIAAVGRDVEVNLPADADIVEAPKQTLLPGLIDSHVHVTMSALRLEDRLMTPRTVSLFQAAVNLRETLKAGFTTVRDAGGADPGLSQAVEMGLIAGPRLVTAAAIGQTGTHMENYFPSGVRLDVLGAAKTRICDGVDEVRKGAREALREGFDFIKICTTGGVISPQDSPHFTEFTIDEIKSIVEAAASRGKAVMAHAEGTQGIKNAILGGVWTVEHASVQDEEATDLLVRSRKILVPTLLLPQYIVDNGKEAGMGEFALKKAAQLHEMHVSSFRKAAKAGVKIALGTDAAGPLHGRNAHELTLMVQGGLSPMQAIVAGTKTASEACRISENAGTIEVGKLADLLLVDGDPLEDITVLEQREKLTVLKQGKKVVV